METLDAVREGVGTAVAAWDNLRVTASMPDVREPLKLLGQVYATPGKLATNPAGQVVDQAADLALRSLPRTLEQVLEDPTALYCYHSFLVAFQARARLEFIEEALRFRTESGVSATELRRR